MVIAKPEWFARRKYSGWGVTPKTWQGWIYLAVIIIPFIVFQSFPNWSDKTRLIATTVLVLFLLIDIFDVMFRLKKDERETIHEAFAERNALWAIMIVLVLGILYQAISSALSNTIKIDWFIITALLAGVIVKAISNIYLDNKD